MITVNGNSDYDSKFFDFGKINQGANSKIFYTLTKY